MKIKTLISIIVLCFLVDSHMQAQVNRSNQNIHIQSRMIDGTPTIKILPANGSVWFRGMKNGYEVAISEYKAGAYSSYRVLESSLKPAAENEFNSPSLPQDYADAIRRLIYEETYAPEGSSFSDQAAASEAMSRKFLIYQLLSAYDPQISDMSGLQFSLPQNLSNLFKIRIKVNKTAIIAEQSMMLSGFYTSLQSPLLELKPGDRDVQLSWSHSPYKSQFVAYRLERSSDGKNFEKMGAPKIFNSNSPAGEMGRILIKDSLPANYENYWYRMAAFDAFGILTEYTEPVKVMSRDMTAPNTPQSVNVEEGEGLNEIIISWTAATTPDLHGFQIIASQSENGDYQRLHQELLPANSREFNFTFDKKPFLFYRVLAVDTALNAAASGLGYLVRYDSIPPEIPVDFTAETDTNYVVTIKWSKSTSEDVKGYRLYKAYHPSNGFVPITGLIITDTTYYDTLADDRLDKKVYYQLVALDQHYNHSEKSEFIFAPIPDKVPPTSPLLMSAVLDKENSVTLNWYKSSSNDVEDQLVLRRLPEDSASVIIATISNLDTLYIDEGNGSGAVEYAEYYLAAIDSSGNRSAPSNGKRILFKEDKNASVISLESAKADGEEISLIWKYPGEGDYSVLVYRAQEGGSFKLVGRVNEGLEYTDQSVRSGNEYKYKVGVIKSNGMRTPLSDVVTVTLD